MLADRLFQRELQAGARDLADQPGEILLHVAALAEASRPFADLCPAEHGGDTLRALCTSHMDGHLKGDADALRFLTGDLTEAFRGRGIVLDVRE